MKVKAIRCLRPPRWYEDYLDKWFEVWDDGPFFNDSGRYWIRSSSVPQKLLDKLFNGVKTHLAIRFEDCEIELDGELKRLSPWHETIPVHWCAMDKCLWHENLFKEKD